MHDLLLSAVVCWDQYFSVSCSRAGLFLQVKFCMEVIFSLFIVFMVLVQHAQENKILTASHGCSCIAGNYLLLS